MSGSGASNLGYSSIYPNSNVNTHFVNIGNTNSENYTHIHNNTFVTGDIQTSGEIYSGATISLSDRNLKTNIQSLDYNIIDKLNPVQYYWIDNINIIPKKKQGKHDVGFIAQEVEMIAPHLVSEFMDIKTKKKYKGVDYVKIVPFLVDEI